MLHEEDLSHSAGAELTYDAVFRDVGDLHAVSVAGGSAVSPDVGRGRRALMVDCYT